MRSKHFSPARHSLLVPLRRKNAPRRVDVFFSTQGTNGECLAGEKYFALVNCPFLLPVASPGQAQAGGYSAGASGKQIIGTCALVVDALTSLSRSRAAFPARATCLLFIRLTIACDAFAFFQLDEDVNIWGMDEWAKVRELFAQSYRR